VGHNALGGWSVITLLASVSVQAVSGLFASDEIDTDGPFATHVSDVTVKLMTRVHHWNENVLLILVCLHVAAVLLYLVIRHDNLIVPMLSGRKRVAQAQNVRFANGWLALALIALCAALIAALVAWAG
jgi:cytochrome b